MAAETFSLFDISIQRLGFSESLNAVMELSQETAVRVFFVDSYALSLSLENRCYKRCLQLAEFCLSEGGGVNVATRFLGEPPMPADIKSIYWVPGLFDRLENDTTRKKNVLFCLGGTYATSDMIEAAVKEQWPSIEFVGHRSGEYTPEEEQGIVDMIVKSRATIVLLGMKSPCQEEFVCRNWHKIKNSGVQMVIAGGESIDAFAGAGPTMPSLARAIRLEWLFKMLLDPGMFYARYLRGGIRFAWYLAKQKRIKEQK